MACCAAARMAARPWACVVAEWARSAGGTGGAGGGIVEVGAERSPPPQPARTTAARALVPARRVARRLGRGPGLAQERTGRLLEDLAPGADLLLLGGEMLDDLAHARGRDLDPVAVADLAEAVVVLREPEGDRLEAVLGDPDARGEVQDRRLEHQLVVGLGLDEQDVDARVALLPLARHLVQALVGEELERLVADLGEAHVADPLRAREDAPHALGEVVDVGDERVDDDDELRPRLHGHVEVGRRDDAPVHELAVADLHRLVDHRQRRRRAHGLRDRDVVPAAGAEHDALARVEVGRREVELGLEQAEVVGAVGVGEHLAHVALDAGARVHTARERLGEPERDVHDRGALEMARDVAQDPADLERQVDRAAQVLEDVGAQQGSDVDVAERGRDLLVDDPHHLLGRHAVGSQRGDEGARRGPDVDVELVDGPIDREEVERAQGADLVHGAGEAATAEDERRLGAPPAATRCGPLRDRLALRGERDDVVHQHQSIPQLCGPARVNLVRMRRLALAFALLVALFALPAPAWGVGPEWLRAKLGRELRVAGGTTGAYVLDLETGRALFAGRADVARPPASVEKLYTTSTALLRLGPDFAFHTQLLAAAAPDPQGVIDGDVWLRGEGDPTLSTARIADLARRLSAAGVTRVSGAVTGDGTAFDQLPGSFRTGGRFDRDLGGALAGLAVARGLQRGRPQRTPALIAARALAKSLRREEIRVAGRTTVGAAPDGAQPLADVPSPPLRTLIGLTNRPSDNYYAEALLKALGQRLGGGGTTAAGAAVVRAELASFGVHPRVADGSGLALAD